MIRIINKLSRKDFYYSKSFLRERENINNKHKNDIKKLDEFSNYGTGIVIISSLFFFYWGKTLSQSAIYYNNKFEKIESEISTIKNEIKNEIKNRR